MPSINCEINFILTWSASCFILADFADGQVPTFAITDTKLYFPLVTLSTKDNTKLLQQLKSGFERAINWNKFQSKTIIQNRNQYLDYLIDRIFQGVIRLFVLSFENNAHQTSYRRYFLPTIGIKYMTQEHMITYEKLRQVKEMITLLVVY